MKRSISLIAVILLIAARVANAQGAPQQSSPFALRVVGPQVLIVDEFSMLEIEVENVSGEPMKFVRPLDGSTEQARYPRISVGIFDSAGRSMPVSLDRWCGVLNPLLTTDIVTFAPGEKRRYGVAWPPLQKHGNYSVKLTYDLTAPDLKSWLGSMTVQDAPAELPVLLKQVPRLILKSAPFQVQVRNLDTQGIAQALVTELVAHNGPPANVLWQDFRERKWEVADVRRANDYFSCVVKFAPGYSPNSLMAGRYLFQPLYDWRRRQKKAAAAERDFIWSRYKISEPGDGPLGASTQARANLRDKKLAEELVPGSYDPTPQMKQQRESVERHPLYRALTVDKFAERMRPAHFPDYWFAPRGLEVSFEPLATDQGYTAPAVGLHFTFEADAIKLISIVGELRYLLLAGEELSTPLRGVVALAGLNETEIKEARVRIEIQPDGQMILWLQAGRQERGAFSGMLGNGKVASLPASPPQQGHRF